MKKITKIASLIIFGVFFLSLSFLYFNSKENRKNKKISAEEKKEKYIDKDISKEPINLEKIFKKLPAEYRYVKKEDDQYSLIVTGDIIPARSVNYIMTKLNDFAHPFKKTADLLKKADMVFINLESPLINNCPITVEGMIFCGNPNFINGMKTINENIIVSIANNHFENYGKNGVNETVELLRKSEILITGNEKIALKKIRGKNFGFLGFNFIPGGKITTEKEIINLISELRKKVDFLIIMYHWGDEYTSFPNKQQVYFAYLSVDLGADLVLGNHPHWIQTVEIYKEKPIVYSHGNFIFDQMWSQKTKEGIIGEYIFNDKEVEDIYFYPVIIENYNQPRIASPDESRKILDEMYNNSKKTLLNYVKNHHSSQ